MADSAVQFAHTGAVVSNSGVDFWTNLS